MLFDLMATMARIDQKKRVGGSDRTWKTNLLLSLTGSPPANARTVRVVPALEVPAYAVLDITVGHEDEPLLRTVIELIDDEEGGNRASPGSLIDCMLVTTA